MRVRLLGGLVLELEGRLLRVPSERRRALLAALALHAGEPVSVDRLIQYVWGEKPPDNAVQTLHAHISYLRRLLRDSGIGRDVLQTARPGYLLAVAPDDIDVARFERDADAGRRALAAGNFDEAATLLCSALDEWRGPVLPDLPDAEFVLPLAASLDDRRASATEDWADAMLAVGRHAETADELRRAVERHPLRERLHAQLMLALYRSGRQAESLRVYQHLRTAMADELGIEPGGELRRLEEAILLQKSELDWEPPGGGDVADGHAAPRTRLPVPATSFVGRDEQLDGLLVALEAPGLVTVLGPAGCGKTRLALEAATRVETTRRAVVLIELGPVGVGTDLWSVVAGALEVREQPGVRLVTAVADELRSRRMLVVLDNCEHVRDAARDVVAELVSEVPDVTVLATTQRALALPGEQLRPLPVLGLAPSVALFTDRAQVSRQRFVVDDANREVVAALCRALEGLPLAIELAAARMATLDAGQLLDRLDRALQLLSAPSQDDRPARHQTLRAALEWGYELMADDERTLFRRLAVFPGGFRLDDAERAASDDQLAAVDIYDVLERLVAASMLVVDDRDEAIRFRLLEPVRHLAVEKLAGAPEERAVWRAQVDNLITKANVLLKRTPPAVAELYREIDNVRAALNVALADAELAERALDLVLALHHLFMLQGSMAEGQAWTEAALAANPDAPATKRAAGHMNAGGMAQQRGRLDEAADHLDHSLAVAIESGDEATAARARFSKGNLAHHLGDPTAAEILNPVAAYARAAGDDDLLMRTLNSLGVIARRQGDLATAGAIIDESVAVARRLGDTMAIVICLLNLGNVRQVAGETADARDRFDEALSIARDAGWERGVAVACGSLGGIEEDAERAVSLYRESLAHARAVNDRPTMATTLINLGRALIRVGDVLGGRAAFEEARALSDQIGDPRGAAAVDYELAVLARRTGDPAAARRFLASALERRTELGDLDRVVEGVEAAAGILTDAGDASTAAELLGAAAAARTRQNLHRDPGDQETWQADLSATQRLLGDKFESSFAHGETLDLTVAVTSTLAALTS